MEGHSHPMLCSGRSSADPTTLAAIDDRLGRGSTTESDAPVPIRSRGRGNLQLRCMAVGWLGTGTAGRTATARGDTEPLASVSSVSARKRKWMA